MFFLIYVTNNQIFPSETVKEESRNDQIPIKNDKKRIEKVEKRVQLYGGVNKYGTK